MLSIQSRSFTALAALLLLSVAPSCETRGQSGALLGAGLGALAGQAIGGDTQATLIGAGVGSGLGYIIGNEQDKTTAATQKATEDAALVRSRITEDPQTAFNPPANNPLTGTTWRLVSLSGDVEMAWASMTVTFADNTKVVSVTTKPDGTSKSSVERYRVVKDVLIVNGDDHLINATFSVAGDQLIVVADDFRAVLEKI